MASIMIIGTLGLVGGAIFGSLLSSGATSQNIANETVNSMVSAATTVAQNCQSSYTQNAITTLGPITSGGNVNIDVNGTQTLKMDSSCLASANTLTNILSEVSQSGQQTANAITQMFSLSSADSKNVTNVTANMSTQITNTFYYNCVNSGTQTQEVNVAGVTAAGDVTIAVSYGQYVETVTQCVDNDSIVSQSKEQLQQSIQQTATTKVANTFAVILGIIFAIIAVVGIIVLAIIFLTKKKSTPPPPPPSETKSITEEADIKALLDFTSPTEQKDVSSKSDTKSTLSTVSVETPSVVSAPVVDPIIATPSIVIT